MPDHPEKPELKTEGRYAYDGIDRVIHEKARLSIVASLAAHAPGLLFTDLKDLCTLTDGNLSRHLAVLHDAGLVEVTKSFKKNRPQTWCKLTANGKKRFTQYVAELEQVVADALKRQKHTAAQSHIATGLPGMPRPI
jgi:DNA-binding MarR family transcriptional regulator